ncbi:MAG TPA: hypothetical protein PK275_09265 [Chitinophagaceae bacterium]|jgi:DNA repair exonuclease SbcCD ATPase subunit|nr:hypothetical protein [Chitinophagaceae bacterium]
MGAHLSLSVAEIIVLLMGAIVLGFAIMYIISSTRAFKKMVSESPGGKISNELAVLKTKYNNETERRSREVQELSLLLTSEKENNEINTIEAEESRKENKLLKAELAEMRSKIQDGNKPVLLNQLRQSQENMMQYQQKIDELLSQLETSESGTKEIERLSKENKALSSMLEVLEEKIELKEKDKEQNNRQETISTELNAQLDAAYVQFDVLQGKIQKLETQLNGAKKESLDFSEMKESYLKTLRELEDLRQKQSVLANQKSATEAELSETQIKLREANFDRQQLQKKVSYLEDLNHDMNTINEANKNLQDQLKRIGELESMLHIVSGERDELASANPKK